MSANDRPDLRAYRELEVLVRGLGEELATFRKRALTAEGQLKDGSDGAGAGRTTGRGASSERVAQLEQENESLRIRVTRAEEQLAQMLDRVRFLRQQLQSQPTTAART